VLAATAEDLSKFWKSSGEPTN